MNTHTARAIAAAKRDYLSFVQCNGIEDLAAWVSDMQARGLAANTIRQRVYLLRPWVNTEFIVQLPAPRNLRERKWLEADQLRALLTVIPRHEIGRRDFALLSTLLVTGQRVGQIRLWRWRNLQQKTVQPILRAVAQAIFSPARNSYSSNMSPLSGGLPNAFIFVTPQHRPGLNRQREFLLTEATQPPVSPQEINRRIRRYARLACLESEGLSAEALRRTRQELGEHAVIMLVQEALEKRTVQPVRWKRLERDPRLHGIGRRRRS